jgi:hypothetical protein
MYKDMYEVPTINDYNLALYNKLVNKTKTVTNDDGDSYTEGFAEINEEDILVTYKNPEAEFRVKQVPAIVLYRHKIMYDPSRDTNDSMVYVNSWIDDETPKDVVKRDYPVPFNIFYSVEFYFKREFISPFISQYIMSKLPKRGVLKINGQTYGIDLEEAPSLTDFGYKTFGEMGTKRESNERLLYKLEGELDLEGDISPSNVVLYHPEFNVNKKEE